MGAKTGSDAYAKYRQNMANATEYIRKGVQNTTKDQAAEAIKALPRTKANLMAAFDNGKVQEGLRKSGHAGWQRGMLNKGVDNIVKGIDSNEANIKSAMDKVVQVGQAIQTAVKDMPKGGIENGVARVRTAMTIAKQAYNK